MSADDAVLLSTPCFVRHVSFAMGRSSAGVGAALP